MSAKPDHEAAVEATDAAASAWTSGGTLIQPEVDERPVLLSMPPHAERGYSSGSGATPQEEYARPAHRESMQAVAYLSAVLTVVKVVTRLVPTLCTIATIATEMPAAIRPYSMAVAPCSSRTKRMNLDI
jgi:hypothetical protein